MSSKRIRGVRLASVAVTSVILCGLAVTQPSASAVPPIPIYSWWVKNYTEETMHGEMYAQAGDNHSQILALDTPLAPGRELTAKIIGTFAYQTYWWGRWCYRGYWYNLEQKPYVSSDGTPEFGLVSLNGPVLWMHVGKRGAGAGHYDKIDLKKTSPC